MTTEEFKDRLFDVINESDEISIRDIKVNEALGEIEVMVVDGSEFVVRCEGR